MLVRLILLLACGYVLSVAFMYFFQRHFQYYPNRNALPTPAEAGAPWMKVVVSTTEDGLKLQNWFVPPKEKDGKIVVIFHGNAGNISHRAIKTAYFYEKNYGVFLAEYRGFGGNPGTPTEKGLYLDAMAAVHYLEAQGYNASQLVIYGESIGTGVAVETALRLQPPQLILEAPFTSAMDVANLSYFWLPVKYLMKDRFESIAKIKDVKSSLLIVHGDEDGVIPITLSQQLYEKANHPKEFVTINGGGHSDLYDHHAGHIIVEWLDRQSENIK